MQAQEAVAILQSLGYSVNLYPATPIQNPFPVQYQVPTPPAMTWEEAQGRAWV
jgi:hypothetical protein